MASPIDILINAVWRGGSATERAQRDLRGLGTTSSRTATNLDETAAASQRTGTSLGAMALKIGVAAAAFGTMSVAAKRVFDLIEEGAGLELTAQRFDRLAASVNSTGVALRSDLLQATDGLLSTAQAMALATDLIGLGLANTHTEAVRLARVVTELDADMGELTLAIANQTTRRFDQLGISLQGFNERLAVLKRTMNDEDAFSMAFLEQAEAQIERVGGVSQTAAGDIRRVQADWAALREELSERLAIEVGPFLADATGRSSTALREQAKEAAAAADSVSDLQRAFNELNRVADELRQRDPVAFDSFVKEGFQQSQTELLRALAQMTDSAEDFEREAIRIFGPQGFSRLISDSREHTVEEFFRISQAIEEAAGADRVLIQAHQQLVEETEAANAATTDFFNLLDGIPDVARNAASEISRYADALQRVSDAEQDFLRRSQSGVAGAAARAAQAGGTPFSDALANDTVLQERTDLFIDFQADISTINQREEEQRLQIVEQFEERRTDLIEDYNERRLQEEEDFQRRQARQDAQLARDIADVQSDTAERQADLRADANRRLADLEEDHLDRMREITENADLALDEAASRLDARAVASIQRNRDKALADEVDRYQDQREDILEELDRRLELEQEAAEERIAELNEFHERRQSEEEEDRRIRLQRMEQAHQDQLRELDKQESRRLQQIRNQAIQERNERERQYTLERLQLDDHWDGRMELERQWQKTILEQEEAWWRQRSNLVGGGATGSDTGGTDGSTGGDDGDDDDDTGAGTHGADRYWMEHQAFLIANPQGTDASLAWQRYFRSLTDEQLAAWIEQHSDIDVPGFLHGGYVNSTGLAMLHGSSTEPEYVLDATTTRQAERMMGTQLTQAGLLGALQSSTNSTRASFGDVNITINESRRPGQTGEEVREKLKELMREAVGE